jgi:hypothetical protein
VTHPLANQAPVLVSPGDQTNDEDDVVSLQLQATDPEGDPLTYSATGLPTGLSIDPQTGLISGQLDEDAFQTTPFPVTVSVTDSYGATTTESLSWTFTAPLLTLQSASINAVEGTLFQDVTVANLNVTGTSNQGDDPFDYDATIDWGDGSPLDSGIITGSSGAYQVQGTHTYQHAGSFQVQVTVADATIASASTTSTATVSDAALTQTAVFAVQTVQGQSPTLPLATFTDANPFAQYSDFTGTINWGDGTALSSAAITGFDGKFVISGSHAYATPPSSYPITITVYDAYGSTLTMNTSASVGKVYADRDVTLTVGTYQASDVNGTGNGYNASISWGDGSAATTGTINASGTTFTVSGGHFYVAPGNYDVVVTVTNAAGVPLTFDQVLSVMPQPLTIYQPSLYDIDGIAHNETDAVIVNADPTSSVTGAPSIDWGDGTAQSSGTVSGANGVFTLTGSHSYGSTGQFAVSSALAFGGGLAEAMVLLGQVALNQANAVPTKTDNINVAGGHMEWTLSAPNPNGKSVKMKIEYSPGRKSNGAAIRNPGGEIAFLNACVKSTLGSEPQFPAPEDWYEKLSDNSAAIGNYLVMKPQAQDLYYGAKWDAIMRQWVDDDNSTVGRSMPGKFRKSAVCNIVAPASNARPGKDQVFEQRFETAVFCISTMQVLGVIKWGFRISDEAGSQIELLDATAANCGTAASLVFKKLVQKANAKVPNYFQVLPPRPDSVSKEMIDDGTSALP